MRYFVYAFRGDHLRAFYAPLKPGSMAGQVKFLRDHGWQVFWRKVK